MYNAYFARNLKFKKFQNKKLIFILQHLVYDFYFDAIIALQFLNYWRILLIIKLKQVKQNLMQRGSNKNNLK